MDKFDMFIQILQRSVEKNRGDTPITLGHLANIAKLAGKVYEIKEKENAEQENRMENDFWDEAAFAGIDE